MSHIDANGTRLYYELEGSGPPVVCVHGAWGDHHNWDQIVPLLAGSYTVLSYDRRGHSQSESVPGQGSAEEDAADLAALLTALNLAPAHGVGNSSGAIVVLRAAIRHPGALRSVFVHEPPLTDLIADNPDYAELLVARRANITPVIALIESGDNEAAARRFMETVVMGPGAWERIPQSDREIFVNNAGTFLDDSRDETMRSIELAALQSFQHPMLLSTGELSPQYLQAIVSTLAEAVPAARTTIFAEAGHIPNLTHPTMYAEHLLDYLDGMSV